MSIELEPHPEIPEGINVSKTHPLTEFGYLVAGVVGIVLVVVLSAQFLAGFLVRYIPFETEKALLEEMSPSAFQFIQDEENVDKTAYLQALAERLVPHMDLPEGMSVQVHYDASDVPNAYATLGGNIVIYQGLIDQVTSENGLAMVVAHEIAHIKNRDPIMSLGRGVVSMIALAAISGVIDSGSIANVANLTGTGLLSKFSRDQESKADEDAVNAVMGVYGHLDGADEFFANMMDEEPEFGVVFFSTHPSTEGRVERINRAGQSSQSSHSVLTPLDAVLQQAEKTVEEL